MQQLAGSGRHQVPSDHASSPIWVMCRGIVGEKLLGDETGQAMKTEPRGAKTEDPLPIRQPVTGRETQWWCG
jgi:hypothetical protein